MRIITLLTDFGLTDWYVGSMKGTILRINRDCQIVDITHQIAPGDVRAGAFALAACYRSFPQGSVHLAVVDPGVGGPRNPIVIQTKRHFFVGPDNGLLSLAARDERVVSIRRLDNPQLRRRPVSATFHGRDIFAPAAAQLSKGFPSAKLGSKLPGFEKLEEPPLTIGTREIIGTVVYVDHYGNLITNIPESSIRSHLPARVSIQALGRREHVRLVEFYQAVPLGAPLALVGSGGFLEISVNGGSAAKKLKAKRGDSVFVET